VGKLRVFLFTIAMTTVDMYIPLLAMTDTSIHNVAFDLSTT